jgi:hypothetical protein
MRALRQGVFMYLLKNWLDSLSNAIVIIPLDVTDTPVTVEDVVYATPREEGEPRW